MLDALQKFSDATGLTTNKVKSSVYFCRVPEGVSREILRLTGFRRGALPMQYLGVPFSPKRWSKLDCQLVEDKITKRISCWTAEHFSYAGRLVLLQSVLQSMSSYWASFFLLLSSICKAMDQICLDFLWGSSGAERKVPLVQWHTVCSAKAKGGLGL